MRGKKLFFLYNVLYHIYTSPCTCTDVRTYCHCTAQDDLFLLTLYLDELANGMTTTRDTLQMYAAKFAFIVLLSLARLFFEARSVGRRDDDDRAKNVDVFIFANHEKITEKREKS